MSIWLGKEENGEDPGHPVATCRRQSLKGNEQWQHPDLRNGGKQKSLVELFREPSEDKQVDDEDDVCWDGQEVHLKCCETGCLEVERDVLLVFVSGPEYFTQ